MVAFASSVADRFSRFALSNPQNVAQHVAVIVESIKADSPSRRQRLTNEEFTSFLRTDSFIKVLQDDSGFIQVYLRPAKGVERMYVYTFDLSAYDLLFTDAERTVYLR